MDYNSTVHQMYMKYLVGFCLSIITTFAAYFLVVEEWATGIALVWFLAALALIQLFVQMYYFLHLGEDKKPHLRALAFWFMTIILAIIVGGSVWIMYHLNYNMMHYTPQQKEQYMGKQYDKGF